MTLINSAGGLAGIRDWAAWMRAVERLLSNLDRRVVALGAGGGSSNRAQARSLAVQEAPPTSGAAGETFVWLGTDAPYATVPVDGRTLAVADYPYLYAVVGDRWSTADTPADQFRLPDLGAPPAGMWVART